ncbi:NAD-dependent histone deacetylase sir2 [Entomortierella lignicola]|nr:NAD-dependent histone deacetylase sir2 [Entomortierella lignicola]
MSHQPGDLTRHQIPQMNSTAPSADESDIKLKVPSDPLSSSRPESPVNRKRTDDDSASGLGHRHQDGSTSSNSLPPSKKSKTSPPLVPTNNNNNNNNNKNNKDTTTTTSNTNNNIINSNLYLNSGNNSGHSLSDYRTSPDDALSPQTSPILEPSVPTYVSSTTEKRYSPAIDPPTQSKARKLDANQPLSPSFRPISPSFHAASPPFRAASPPFRAASPSFGGSATAILDSLSKPGENSLGNLNLGTPIIGRTPVGERVMGVITSQPNSRQSSPDPRPMSGITESKGRPSAPGISASAVTEALEEVGPGGTSSSGENDLIDDTGFSLDTIPDTDELSIEEREFSPSATMPTCSEREDDDEDDEEGQDNDDGDDDNDDDDDPLASAEEPMHPTEEIHEYGSGEDDDEVGEFGQDSMDEIDVEGMEMLESDSESEGTPYNDPDPMCVDRFTEEESDAILEEARMNGIGFVIRKYILSKMVSTKKMLLLTIPEQIEIPEGVTENDLIRTISERLKKILRRRRRLQHIHSLDHVVSLIKNSKRIMVLTGAGVSVSCGIPDFRSEDGIYSRLSEFELDDPQQMFDLDFFRERPQIFYSFAREIFPSNFIPSPSHYFIKLLESQDKLLRNYTQNIDTLEQKAGIRKVLQCHGSFATASCVRCGHQVPGDEIKEQIFKQEVAYCKVCKTPSPPPKAKKRSKSGYHSSDDDDDDDDDDESTKALMKPDIVFFGEKLPAVFHQSLKEDREKVDLLIVIGSSLKVAPVSDIMHQLPNSVPQILINRTPNHQMEFDVQLLGNCDNIVAELCRMVGWELKHEKLPGGTSNVPNMDVFTNKDGSGAGGRAAWTFMEPNTYLFEGADLEEINFEAIQEQNRKRLQREAAAVEGHEGDEDEDENEDEEEEEELDDDGDMQDMEGLTTELSRRQLPLQDGWQTGTHVGASSSSSLLSPRHHSIAGFATGTTEPRSGSIEDIHHDILSAAAAEAAASLRSPIFASSSHFSLHGSTSGQSHASHDASNRMMVSSEEDVDDDEDEENKIRLMFTEKMPKDLGEDDIDIVGYSRRPSEDLGPIPEDTQEVDVEDHTDDDDDDIVVDNDGIESSGNVKIKDSKLEEHS